VLGKELLDSALFVGINAIQDVCQSGIGVYSVYLAGGQQTIEYRSMLGRCMAAGEQIIFAINRYGSDAVFDRIIVSRTISQELTSGFTVN
jgi:hypothetical protein